MAGVPIYRTDVAHDWIDYNGHLRDAYYVLIVSQATDALMDRLQLDAAYRARTRGTLYTLEMHLHFLREIKESDGVAVSVRVLGADSKRLHVALELTKEGESEPAATAELMLLHVVQGPTVSVAAFPPEVSAAIAALAAATAAMPAAGPLSRRMELTSRPRP